MALSGGLLLISSSALFEFSLYDGGERGGEERTSFPRHLLRACHVQELVDFFCTRQYYFCVSHWVGVMATRVPMGKLRPRACGDSYRAELGGDPGLPTSDPVQRHRRAPAPERPTGQCSFMVSSCLNVHREKQCCPFR